MNLPKIVTQVEWLAARREFLVKEKEFTRQRHALSEALRNLPMVKVEKDYVFDGPQVARDRNPRKRRGGVSCGQVHSQAREMLTEGFTATLVTTTLAISRSNLY